MAKRRKRRSQKSFDERLMKDIRAKRIAFLRDLSEMVSNAAGVKIRCAIVGGEVITPQPPKRKGKVQRRTAHIAGYQHEPRKEHPEPDSTKQLPNDPIET